MDVFPVQVTVAGRLHSTCRLHSDGITATVWKWDYQTRSPKVVVEFGPDGVPVVPAELGGLPWNLEHEGAPLVVQDQRHCGCSHPLKDFDPAPRPVREHTS